jgi:argininosuccinate lyase
MFEEDVYNAVALETCLNNRQVVGGPSSKVEKENIERIEKKVSDYHD